MKFKKLVVTQSNGSFSGKTIKTFKNVCDMKVLYPEKTGYSSDSKNLFLHIEYLGGITEITNVTSWEGFY